MRTSKLLELLKEKYINHFIQMRENMKEEEDNILKIQEENVKLFYRKREEPKT